MGFIEDVRANWRFLLPFYVGIFRWGMFIVFKVIPALMYRQVRPKDLDRETGRIYYRPSDVTVVVPVYQPGPSFPDNMVSLAQKSPNTLIAVADVTCYEDTCAIFRKVQELYPSVNCRVIKEYKPGKRPALVAGLKETRTALIAFVDDDTQWIPMDFLPNLILPFSYDEKCGGVGCKQVMRPKGKRPDVFEIVSDMRLSARYIEIRATTLVDKCCSCISGRTMAFRTNIIQNEEFYKFFLDEKFFGMQLQSGDDKALTRYLISNDYSQYHQLNNDCKLTTTFESGMRFIKQNIRWSRNTFRSDFAALFIERRIWRRDKFTAIVLFDKMFIPFFMMYGLCLVPILAIVRLNYIMFVLWVIWLIFSRIIKLSYYLVENPWRIFSMPAFIIWQYIAAVIKIYAMFTCYNRTWGTRDITVKDGQVVRTNEGAKNAANLMKETNTGTGTGGTGEDDTDELTDTGSGSSEYDGNGNNGKKKRSSHKNGNGNNNGSHRMPHHLHPNIERDDFGRGHVPPPPLPRIRTHGGSSNTGTTTTTTTGTDDVAITMDQIS